MTRQTTAARGGMRPRPTLRQRVFDTVETVFGPDPGLIRLVMATRAVVAAAMTLTILLLITGGVGKNAIAAIALGFMVSILSNMAVRDPSRAKQATTLALLVLPALGAVVTATYLTKWQWIADIGFVVVVTLAVLARALGPRGMAFGMIAYIGYFMGEVIRPSLAGLPLVALGVVVGLACSAIVRFVLFPDRPAATLRRLRHNIYRRIARIVASAWAMLETSPEERSRSSQAKRDRRLHYEVIRLNEAFLIAGNQLDGLGNLTDDQRAELNGRLFDLELAAERLMRIAAACPDVADRVRARRRLTDLHQALVARTAPTPARHLAAHDLVEIAIDDLERALAAVGWGPEEAPTRTGRHAGRRPLSAERRHA